MKIKQALFTAGYSSFYFDDQQAIKNGAGHDGFIYTGNPVTPGFTSVRQAGESANPHSHRQVAALHVRGAYSRFVRLPLD